MKNTPYRKAAVIDGEPAEEGVVVGAVGDVIIKQQWRHDGVAVVPGELRGEVGLDRLVVLLDVGEEGIHQDRELLVVLFE